MFSSRSLFSHIPCPYNDDCKLPQCLFLHAPPPTQQLVASSGTVVDRNTHGPANAVRSNAAEVRRVPGEVTDEHDFSQDVQPRKRQKLASGEGKDVSANAAPPPPRLSTPAREVGNDLGSKTASTVAKSSPGNKPALPSVAKSSDSTKDLKPKMAAEKPKDLDASVAKADKTPEAPIAEGLFPRNLTPAPAKYELRLRLVRALHEHLVRLNAELSKADTGQDFVLSAQALITLALDIELAAARGNATVYPNVIKNKILYYKRLSLSDWKEERKKDMEAKAPPGNKASALSPRSTGAPKRTLSSLEPIITGLPESHELRLLHRLYVDFAKVPPEHHGFVLSPPTDEMIAASRKGLESSQNWECCVRCTGRYQVFPGRRESDGALSTGGPCTFHWGKAFQQDLGKGVRGRGDRKYLCCGEAVGVSAGCATHEHHVFRVAGAARLASVLPFVATPENAARERELGATEVLRPVCLDGEMAFTVHGMELVRLTATSWPRGAELLDVLVRPLGEVLDMNTRFSGVSVQLLTDAKPWSEHDPGGAGDLRIVRGPVEARALLLRLLTPRTPIVGHGLENDFNALRLIHPTVIDTSILWPAKSGLPYRQPLKGLAKTLLNVTIQHVSPARPPAPREVDEDAAPAAAAANGGIGGHDSKEDANAAGALVHHALREEWAKLKRQGWAPRDPDARGTIPSTCATSASPAREPSLPAGPLEQYFIPPRTALPARSTTQRPPPHAPRHAAVPASSADGGTVARDAETVGRGAKRKSEAGLDEAGRKARKA